MSDQKWNSFPHLSAAELDDADGLPVSDASQADGSRDATTTIGELKALFGGGASAWGDLTGTLADQTDLQNALNAKADASSLATVATSGDYDDLSNKPTLGSAAAADTGDFATAAQGGKADTALQPGDELTTLASTGATAGHVPKADGSGGIQWAAESGGGGGGGLAVRHDNTGAYDYTGAAASGTPEASSGWAVTRVTLSSPVVIERGTGAWSDRASLVYT